jgi:hypothetical protein
MLGDEPEDAALEADRLGQGARRAHPIGPDHDPSVGEAIAALRTPLHGTALRLTDHNGRVGVVVAESHVSDDEMRRVYLEVVERESPANDELTMLKAIADGLVRSDHERTLRR